MKKKSLKEYTPESTDFNDFLKGVAVGAFDEALVCQRFSQQRTDSLITLAQHPSVEIRKAAVAELGNRQEAAAEAVLIHKAVAGQVKEAEEAFEAAKAIGKRATIFSDVLLVKLAEDHLGGHFVSGVADVLASRLKDWDEHLLETLLLHHRQDKLRLLAIKRLASLPAPVAEKQLFKIAKQAGSLRDKKLAVELLALRTTHEASSCLLVLYRHYLELEGSKQSTSPKDLFDLIHYEIRISIEKRGGLKRFLIAIQNSQHPVPREHGYNHYASAVYNLFQEAHYVWNLIEIHLGLHCGLAEIEDLARWKLFRAYERAKPPEKEAALKAIWELAASDTYEHWEPAMKYLKEHGLLSLPSQ